MPAFVHVTALMASSGFLWIGTSVGLILIYHIPHLEGIPIVSGKPYLAMDGHKGSVRVLLPVKTMATISSSRVDQFLSDEQRRTSVVSQLDDYEDSEGLRKLAALMENKDTEGRAEIGVEGEENEEGRDGILAEREENGAGGTEIQLQNVTSLVNDVPVLEENGVKQNELDGSCLLYTSPSPRDATLSRMPSSA